MINPGESIYIVAHSDPESYCPAYVVGPTVPDWKAFCVSLMPEAVKLAVARAKKGQCRLVDWTSDNDWILDEDDNVYYENIAFALYRVILSKGYREIKFPGFEFRWRWEREVEPEPGFSGMTAELVKMIEDHNKGVS